jgi:hypothetical protein
MMRQASRCCVPVATPGRHEKASSIAQEAILDETGVSIARKNRGFSSQAMGLLSASLALCDLGPSEISSGHIRGIEKKMN